MLFGKALNSHEIATGLHFGLKFQRAKERRALVEGGETRVAYGGVREK
jgi:hypothetical protein